jgi:uncharacterized membrane protein YqjE
VSDAEESTVPPPGLRASLGRLADGALALVRTRAELVSVELAEERDRLVRRLAFLLGGVLLLAFAALYAGAFVIVLFWDSHRLLAIAGVTLVLAVVAVLLLGQARSMGRDAPAPFAASLAELDKDYQWLQRAARPPTAAPEERRDG